MARRYINPRVYPDAPDNLADFLDQVAGERFAIAPGEVFGEYARKAMARDPGLREQLRDQLAGVSGGAQRPGLLPGMSAAEALYRTDVPGAQAYRPREFTAGSFLRAAWHERPDAGGRKRLDQVLNSFGSEVPADGGFLIPEDVRSDLVWASLPIGIVRQRARVFPASTLRTALPVIDDTTHSGSVLGGLTAYWAEEGATLTESQSAFSRVFLDAKKLVIFANTPNELVADAPAWDVYIRQAVPEAIAYYEDIAYMTGTGVGEPAGMISSPGTVSVAKETGQASATIVWENLVKMASRMLPASLGRAVWMASIDCFPQLATMALAVGTGGGPVFNSQNGMTIFGRPVFFNDFQPQVGSTGDIVFIDPAFYAIADRGQLQVDSSPHPKWNFDVTEWRIRSRQDARPLLQSAITPQNGASGTLSAYVQIAGR